MFCPNCGTNLPLENQFCTSCGHKLPTHLMKSTPPAKPIATTKPKSSKKRIFLTIILLGIVAALCIVGINYYQTYSEQKEQERQEQAKKDREYNIMKSLRAYCYYPYGINNQDFNTAQYSGALGYISDAALGEGSNASLKDASKKEKKEYAFNMIGEYIESDYSKTYAALIFGADYFDQDEISQFYNGTKLSSDELKHHAEDLMCRNAISLSSLLINEDDKIICLNIGARLSFTQRGYMTTNELVNELYDFVYNGSPMPTIDEDLLLESISEEYIQENFDEFFSGPEVYYDELSPVGQMVFLYVMPSYISTFDLNAANSLWSAYAPLYEDKWNEIINRDNFSDILR